jgi:hypothetical protein
MEQVVKNALVKLLRRCGQFLLTVQLESHSGVPYNIVIARKVSQRTDVAIRSGALHGMPGQMRALPYAFAGLPRRANALLAMTTCGEGKWLYLFVSKIPVFQYVKKSEIFTNLQKKLFSKK